MGCVVNKGNKKTQDSSDTSQKPNEIDPMPPTKQKQFLDVDTTPVTDARDTDVVLGATALAVDYIVQRLVECGVTHVFGGHGGAVVPLIDAICQHPNLTWVYTRCEVNASLAAAAYAKLRNGLGCCIGTSGPGSSHLTTGLLDAELDRCPVLCITGMKNSDKVGFSDFQDIDQTALFRAAGISYSMSVIHKQSVVPLLRDAIAHALTNCSCSHLAIPFDIQKCEIELPKAFKRQDGKQHNDCLIKYPDGQQVKDCAAYLHDSVKRGQRILMAVGHRAVDYGTQILELSETLKVPIVTTQDAKGIVSEAHPHAVGVFGIFGNPGMEASRELVETADTVLSIGVDEHSLLITDPKGVQQRKLVEIDISTNVCEMRCDAEFHLIGDIGICCQQLATEIAKTGISNMHCSEIEELGGLRWGCKNTLAKTGFNAENLNQRPSSYEVPEDEITDGFCHPGRVLKLLGPKLGEGAITCIDVGDVTLWASMCLCLAKPGQRMIASMRLGTMGYSICGAIAAGAYRPESHIVAIAGDGGVQMATNELATLQQMRISKLLIIVFVNKKLGRVANEIWGPNAPPARGCEIVVPDFCKLAEAHGGTGIRITDSDPAKVREALDSALAVNGLCILEVMQDPAVKPLMAKRSRGSRMRVSLPFIEDTVVIED